MFSVVFKVLKHFLNDRHRMSRFGDDVNVGKHIG